MQIEFAHVIQRSPTRPARKSCPRKSGAPSSANICRARPLRLRQHETLPDSGGKSARLMTVEIRRQQAHRRRPGQRPDRCLRRRVAKELSGKDIKVIDYREHAIGTGADASAVAYVEMRKDGDEAAVRRRHRPQHRHRVAAGGGKRGQPGRSSSIGRSTGVHVDVVGATCSRPSFRGTNATTIRRNSGLHRQGRPPGRSLRDLAEVAPTIALHRAIRALWRSPENSEAVPCLVLQSQRIMAGADTTSDIATPPRPEFLKLGELYAQEIGPLREPGGQGRPSHYA